MSEPSKPRPRPCASCPYRCDVPSGVWARSEYEKLPGYDGDMAQQRPNVFMCHQTDGHVCSGWLGHKDPLDLLAVRLGISFGTLDPSCADYSTEVPLFGSGEEAAEHGMAEIVRPGESAKQAIEKIKKVRSQPGRTPLEGA